MRSRAAGYRTALIDGRVTVGESATFVVPEVWRANPSRPEMKASLILFGAGIGHGQLQGARLIDVAPTAAAWLGLELADSEGKPLAISPDL